MERKPQRYPSQSPLTEEKREQLKAWVRERPDRTLAELQAKLRQEYGLRISLPPIWKALQNMGLRLKKNSTRRNRTRPGSSKRGRRSGKK
jgi:transposase